ncbi:MAG: ribosome maturation factor RimM [Hyphomicrobiaceae bacterium]
MSKDARVLLGRIAGAHGLKGEVIVHAFTERPEDVAAYGPVADDEGRRVMELKVVRVTDKGVIARLSGVGDRTQAEGLKGMELWVPRERLPDAGEGEFYHADLIGLAALAPDGAPVGTVVAVQNYGAGDLLEIRLAGSKRTELVAFKNEFVPEVDISGGRVVVVIPAANTDEEGSAGGGRLE